MRGQAYPLFESGHILRREMLTATADYAFKFSELLYEGYSDGIISGCRLTTTADTIIVNPGMLIHQGIIYLIKEPMAAAYFPTDTTCVLKLDFLGESREENFVYYDIELRIDERTTMTEKQIELCRFKLQQGAVLRHLYVDFEDRGTEYDTLNIIHTPFAAKGNPTLSPEITQAYAMELMQTSSKDPIDIAFAMQALDMRQPLAAEMIMAYLNARYDVLWQQANITNEFLYKILVKLLCDIKHGNAQKGSRAQTQRRKIIID